MEPQIKLRALLALQAFLGRKFAPKTKVDVRFASEARSVVKARIDGIEGKGVRPSRWGLVLG